MTREICSECGGKYYAKGLCRRCYNKEYRHQPKNKARIKKYHEKSEVKIKKKIYSQLPSSKVNKKKLKQTSKYKNYTKEYNKRPKVIERVKKWSQLSENKLKQQKYNKRPEIKERRKKYYELLEVKNRENKNHMFKYYNNILYNLKVKMRGRLKTFFKLKNLPKNKSTMEIVGCTPQELREHIEKQFAFDMSWSNVLNGEIHIDHIIPLDSAKIEEDIYRLCHYTNLQPLWAEDNLSKGCKLNWAKN